MEQIIRSILKQQSIDQIGVFDQEKDIWMYVKDEEVHFCKSVRYALGQRVRNQLRIIPELRFFIDDSLDYIDRIDELLKK